RIDGIPSTPAAAVAPSPASTDLRFMGFPPVIPIPCGWDFGRLRLMAVAAVRLQSPNVCKTGPLWKPILIRAMGVVFFASCSQATFAFDDAEPFENCPAERPENVSIT